MPRYENPVDFVSRVMSNPGRETVRRRELNARLNAYAFRLVEVYGYSYAVAVRTMHFDPDRVAREVDAAPSQVVVWSRKAMRRYPR